MNSRGLIKLIISKVLRSKGFYLSKTRTRMDEALINMSMLGLRPASIIDIGVANGTSELYETFPDAQVMLIEPLEEFTPYLKDIMNKYNANYIIAAASDKAGVLNINVHPDLCGTSMLKEEEGASVDGIEREVKAVTVDEICKDNKLPAPYVVKIDVQGGELKVLDGAIETLKLTDVVILEISFHAFFKNGPELSDVIVYMKEKGFSAYDIFDGRNRPLDGALAQVDIAFVQDDGWLRKNKEYCSPSQRKQLTKNIREKHTAKIQ